MFNYYVYISYSCGYSDPHLSYHYPCPDAISVFLNLDPVPILCFAGISLRACGVLTNYGVLILDPHYECIVVLDPADPATVFSKSDPATVFSKSDPATGRIRQLTYKRYTRPCAHAQVLTILLCLGMRIC
jgi:hypothetical protein